jgi:hypothetical protein
MIQEGCELNRPPLVKTASKGHAAAGDRQLVAALRRGGSAANLIVCGANLVGAMGRLDQLPQAARRSNLGTDGIGLRYLHSSVENG